MGTNSNELSAAFSSGDAVTVELRGAGYTTTEDATILEVEDGIAWVDNGPGNDPDPYDAATGKYARESFGGFSRRIVRAAG